ncbi:MAG: T9SS type A sorting domain-containing protein [Panacibacter sp.]
MKTCYTKTVNKSLLLFVIPLLICQHVYAQYTFRKVNGGNEFDYGNCVLETPDKGLCIIGSTSSFGSGNDDVYIVKLDSSGNMQWSKTFDWGRKEYGLSAVITRDKGIAVTGYCFISFFSDTLWDAFVLKLDSKGNTLWNKTIGGSGQDYGRNIIENLKGELLISGCTRSYGKGLNDIYLTKLTPQGDLVWSKTYGTTGDDIAYSVTATRGGFAFAGASNGFRPFVTKCDSSGNVIWSKTISGNTVALGAFNSIIQTDDNGLALTGYTKTSTRGYDVLNVKLASNGKVEWFAVLGDQGDDKGNSIIQDKRGNYVITGYVDYARRGHSQSLNLIKISRAGVLLWHRTITEQLDAIGNSVIRWNNDGYVVAGAAWQNVGGDLYKPDLYLAQFDTLGIICGTAGSYNSLRKLTPHVEELNFDTSNGCIVTASIVNTYTGGAFSDECPPPVMAATEITEQKMLQKVRPFHITVIPNPVTNGVLRLRIDNNSETSIQWSITDMKGSLVFTQNMQVPAQSSYTNINISKLPPGIYVLKANNNFVQESIKFIKVN